MGQKGTSNLITMVGIGIVVMMAGYFVLRQGTTSSLVQISRTDLPKDTTILPQNNTVLTPDESKKTDTPLSGLILQSLSPTSGPIGTKVTIVGAGIYGNEAINTVTFSSKLAIFNPTIVKVETGKIIVEIPPTMPDGCYPQTEGGGCDPSGATKTAPGIYSVSVRTSGVDSSNALTFTVK